ncbi:hypothetical protein FRZ67_13070 [Panacibacter ginsenosidivorans]|uniref:Uncharacterized protein n=1 Tax=Panacibacter ginsenosidivorans TaxID=1813871 RepID=A0A5B8VBX6_9BACT|nr:hypothetical protein [Panacibacter ginsenosidivorans]QEC68186.1 hypothetical protein FRZ67_13070 [Panacibacter ginsenosidivorans]
MNKLLFFSLLFITSSVCGQENYEIQVYGAQTQQKSSTIFELHSNYTFDGERQEIKGVRPTYHALHETIEITHGITDNFELGFYLFMNYLPGYGFNVIGTHLRPRIMAPAKWKLPVGLSLSAEIGYQSAHYSAETWSIELRPIIDKQWEKLYISLNPTLGVQLKGIEESSAPAFAPNIKANYAFFKNGAIGAEYYGDLGPLNAFEKGPQQSQAIFATFDLLNNTHWELNTGAGFGLTDATDGFVFKVLVGRRIYWNKEKK